TSHRRKGIGSRLISQHIEGAVTPMLVGCLKAMPWAIAFYQHHGFSLLSDQQRDVLRNKYWNLPEAHVRQSVVLADKRWLNEYSGKLDSSAGQSIGER